MWKRSWCFHSFFTAITNTWGCVLSKETNLFGSQLRFKRWKHHQFSSNEALLENGTKRMSRGLRWLHGVSRKRSRGVAKPTYNCNKTNFLRLYTFPCDSVNLLTEFDLYLTPLYEVHHLSQGMVVGIRYLGSFVSRWRFQSYSMKYNETLS